MLQDRTGNDSILFLYNAGGAAYGMICKTGETESTYYYLFNAQGDVIALLDSTGNCVAEYAYDEWGKLLTITGSQADTTGLLNPIRYRSYYYDSETGFYYLQSRYYDPEIGRFINADGILGGNNDLLSFNLFTYCGNNPTNRTDPTGYCYYAFGKWCHDSWEYIGGYVRKPEPRNVTKEVDTPLEKATEKGKEYENLYFGSAYSLVASEVVALTSFYSLVNHEASWDIKRENSWEQTIQTEFPGQGTLVYYHDMPMTPESLGNYTYGYIGAAYGFPLNVLIFGSEFAAGFPKTGKAYENELHDQFYVALGYNAYKEGR